MYTYTVTQWILFFYLYCFAGWLWESGFVSVRTRKVTNRGFMRGPFLPIYGSGAIIILLATIPVKDNAFFVFLFGMVAASVLEYVTGVVMERLFYVRYWDYSNQFCNLNGYICLKCSLVWGLFSILMVDVIHVPIERFVLWLPDMLQQGIAFGLTVYFVADFTSSFRDAMDFRQMLVTLTEQNEEVRRLLKRMEVASAFAEDDVKQLREEINTRVEESKERIVSAKQDVEEYLEQAKDTADERLAEWKARENERFLELKENRDEPFAQIKEDTSEIVEQIKQNRRKKLAQMKETREYRRAKGIMHRNTIVAAKRYREALEQLREKHK